MNSVLPFHSLHTYEQMAGESSKAFEAFALYRDMGSQRSMRQVEQRLNKSLTLLAKWSKKWNWQERIRAYDADLDRKTQAQNEEKHIQLIRDYRERCQRTAEVAHESSILMLEASVKRLHSLDPTTIAPGELAGLVRAAAQVIQLAAAMEAEALSIDRLWTILQSHNEI